MSNDSQFHLAFVAVILCSILIPAVIYVVMVVKRSISRITVAFLGLTLIVVASVDAVLLHHIAHAAQQTSVLWDDKLFASELSIALYLLPLVSAGIGINILSHLLITHLTEAEQAYDHAYKETK
ncbi:MAG: hypothetical protein HOP20_01415 [Sulfuriferula sp.]|nr:hypothetical protein [Sulfuriferula sp.]